MFDVVIVGGGVAGLRASLEARRLGKTVAIITKGHPLSSFSSSIQDGMNASIGSEDSWESHAEDTIRSGQSLNDQRIVSSICKQAPQILEELDKMGLPLIQ